MHIIKRILLPVSWSLLAAMTVSGCTYYAALERETERKIRTNKELEEYRGKGKEMREIAGERKARWKKLKKELAAINRELDELERRKKKEDRKINKLYAEKRQLKKSRENLIKKREEELLRVKKEFEPEIKRLKAEKAGKKKELSKLKKENTE